MLLIQLFICRWFTSARHFHSSLCSRRSSTGLWGQSRCSSLNFLSAIKGLPAISKVGIPFGFDLQPFLATPASYFDSTKSQFNPYFSLFRSDFIDLSRPSSFAAAATWWPSAADPHLIWCKRSPGIALGIPEGQVLFYSFWLCNT